MEFQVRAIIFYVLAGLFITLPVHALSFYGNQSALRWKTASTENFDYHYPAEYQAHAARIAGFAEAVHDTLAKRYHYQLPGKVNLVVRNALFSNGEANSIYNMMNVWLTDWDFKVRTTHDWMRDVVTHEFSHLVSIQSGSKLAPYIHGLQFGYQDFINERSQGNVAGVLPFTLTPLWFAEGTAQYESSRMGFDAWDTHRDMLLRTAVLADSLLPLEYMHDFPSDALGGEKGPYNQGFSLVRYLSSQYGDDVVPAIWAEFRRLPRSTMDGALQRVIGIGEQELYTRWKRDREDHYRKIRDGLLPLRTGIKRTKSSSFQDFPILVGKDLYGLSNFGGPGLEGELFRMPRTPDSTGVLDMSSFAYEGFDVDKAWLVQGISVRNSNEGPLLAYVTYRNRDRAGRAYFDIVVADTLGRHRPVTRFADAVSPDLSPSATHVVFTRREMGGTRFFLSVASVGPIDGHAEDYRDLLAPPDSLPVFGIYTPRWSPDGKSIVFSFYDGVSRKIASIGTDGKDFRVLVAGAYDARDPAWSPDGKSLYYSCDSTGIFDLYHIDLQSKAKQRLTRGTGGAFTPVADSSGLYYVGYDADGFSLYQLNNDSLALAMPVQADSAASVRQVVQKAPLEVNSIEFAGVERNYLPLPILPVIVPMFVVEERSPDFGAVAQGVAVPKAGVAMGISDPLQKNFVQMALLLEVGKGFGFIDESGLAPDLQSDFFAMLENRSFPITLAMAYQRRNIASRDTVRYEDPRSHDDSLHLSRMAVTANVIQGGAGYSLFKKGDSLSIGAAYEWSAFNLYEDGFAWDYHKRTSVAATLSWLGSVPDNGSNTAGVGNGIVASYGLGLSQLYRPGTFAESFTVDAQGVITPRYRDYTLQEGSVALFGSLGNPLHSGARLAGGVKGAGVLFWNGPDTLDNFYRYPLLLDGYPLLLNSESYRRQGEHTVVAELHYLFPIYDDWRKNAWIFTTRDLYVDVFAQTGNAWDGSGIPDEVRKRKSWDRSVGLEWRWSNRLFYTTPFDVSFRIARALDRVDQDNEGNGGRRVTPLDVPVLPSVVSPTQVRLNIGMGFSNGWMGARTSPHMP